MSEARRYSTANQLPPHTILGYIQTSGSSTYDQLTIWVEKQPSREALIKIAESLERQSNVERVEFIDNPAFVQSDPPLGTWVRGDTSQVKQKDWSKQPSEQDVTRWEDFFQADDRPGNIDEEPIIRDVARRHSIDFLEARDSIFKVRSWIVDCNLEQ